jgi:hypothetical protein
MSDNFNIQAFVQKTRKEYFDNMYRKPLIKEELDPETADRIDGLTNLEALNSLLDAAEMIYKDQIESGDEFDPADVAEYLHSEIAKRLMSLDSNDGMNLREADEEEDIAIDTLEEPTDAPEADMNTEPDMGMEAPVDLATGGDSKEIFGKLVDAYEAAKGLGDEKLTRQLANTITYFNKAVIFGEPKQ